MVQTELIDKDQRMILFNTKEITNWHSGKFWTLFLVFPVSMISVHQQVFTMVTSLYTSGLLTDHSQKLDILKALCLFFWLFLFRWSTSAHPCVWVGVCDKFRLFSLPFPPQPLLYTVSKEGRPDIHCSVIFPSMLLTINVQHSAS